MDIPFPLYHGTIDLEEPQDIEVHAFAERLTGIVVATEIGE